MRRLLPAFAALLLAVPALDLPADAGYSRGGYTRTRTGRLTYRRAGYRAPRRIRARRPARTIRKRRDIAERNRFRRMTGYPSGRPGYQVDHRVALCAGGADSISNMQWLSISEHRIKTRRDVAGCRRR